MARSLFIPILFLTATSFGQSNSPEGLQNEIKRDFESTRRRADSVLHPGRYAKSRLEGSLLENFPKNSVQDGRWVFYRDRANIEKIDKPLVKTITPNFDFYQVTLTNYLGWHVNQGTCVLLFDSIKSKTVLVEPLWYGGISKPLLKLFIGQKFGSKDSFLNFLTELNELMQVGSRYEFRLTSYSDSLVTFELEYFKGDIYTTGGNGTNSIVRYNDDGVWRKIIVHIKELAIIRYIAVNPKMNDKVIFE